MSNINDFGMPFTSQAGDRAYSALDWRSYFGALLIDGIIGNVENELKVNQQETPNKTVYVDTGAIFISGAMRVMTTVTNLPLNDNTSGDPRIDRIVVRLDLTNRKINFSVKQGLPAANPNPPGLIQNNLVWELSLAKIILTNGYSTITSDSILDERSDTTACGYFRYRAKPAWYPGGSDVPIDAWIYLLFKNQLDPAEKADIETNSTLMSIIRSSQFFSAGRSLTSLVSMLELSDLTVSTNTTLASNVVTYDNLTINSGVTLNCSSSPTFIYVRQTLNLNGTISANGLGAQGGAASDATAGAGGNGGGVIIIFASKITGSGFIKANGINGGSAVAGTPTATGSSVGGVGSFNGYTLPQAGNTYTIGSGPDSSKITNTPIFLFSLDLNSTNNRGGCGGSSGYSDSASSFYSRPGVGGNGVAGIGGNTGSLTVSGACADGGGGGGGGALVIISDMPILGISLETKGGNGGSAAAQVYGRTGGGGGGGLISIVAPDVSAYYSVAGGTGLNSGAAGLVENFRFA